MRYDSVPCSIELALELQTPPFLLPMEATSGAESLRVLCLLTKKMDGGGNPLPIYKSLDAVISHQFFFFFFYSQLLVCLSFISRYRKKKVYYSLNAKIIHIFQVSQSREQT